MDTCNPVANVAYAETSEGLIVHISEECYDWLKEQYIQSTISSEDGGEESIHCITSDTTSLTVRHVYVRDQLDYDVELMLCMGQDLRGKRINLSSLLYRDLLSIWSYLDSWQVSYGDVVVRLLKQGIEQVARDFRRSSQYRGMEWDFCE